MKRKPQLTTLQNATVATGLGIHSLYARSRQAGFPGPVGSVGAANLFRTSELVEWSKRHRAAILARKAARLNFE